MNKSGSCTFLTLVLIGSICYAHNNEKNQKIVSEKRIFVENILNIGSDKEGENFYSPMDFTIGNNGDIFILDSGNSRIRVYDKNGIYKYSFGKNGQGPGELSNRASRIKILDDENIYIIDNLQRRVNVYHTNGIYINSFKLKSSVDDLVMINKEYYYSNLLLRPNYKPIGVTKDFNYIKQFGEIYEPTSGIIKTVSESRESMSLENEFLHMNMTSIVNDPDGYITYSQMQPYALCRYNSKGDKIMEVKGVLEFDTHFPLEISFMNSGVRKTVTGRVPRVFAPIRMKNGNYIVFIVSPDRSYFVVDLFDKDLKIKKRSLMDNKIYDFKKSAGITTIAVDKENKMYCLIVSKEENPKISVFKILE